MSSTSDSSQILAEAAESLAFVHKIEEITAIVAKAARALCRADGATFVLRDEGNCYYVDEDAISPLWKGKRFPLKDCISGWSMIHGQSVLIPNIYEDERVPHDVYRPTFVQSLCMTPIRPSSPLGAIGSYWAKKYTPTDAEVKLLQALANCAAVAVENWELRREVEKKGDSESKLKLKKDELETAFHTLAHDLRSPLTSILAFADLLRTHMGTKLDARSKAYIESIYNVGMNSSNVINRMLALYRLTTCELRKQKVDLTMIGSEIEAQIRAQNTGKNIRFVIDRGMSASADSILIRLVIENLFSNAVKFSKENYETAIHFGTPHPGSSSFYIKDNGIGFSSDDAKLLFRPQGRLRHEKEYSGNGLGLASVAKIIEAHGGSVRAEGKTGEGATFFFELPI